MNALASIPLNAVGDALRDRPDPALQDALSGRERS